METIQHRKTSLTGRILFVAIIILTGTILVHAVMSIDRSNSSIRRLMETRMLNITNSAAAQILPEDMKELTGSMADSKTVAFQRIVNIFSVYEKNVTLEYIYGVKKLSGGYAVVVENNLEGEDEFGERIPETPALRSALKGVPAVDEAVDVDRWGRFYTAFSPVYDTDKNIVGLVAVDFNADAYDAKSFSQDVMIILVCVFTLLGSFLVVVVITGHARREVRMRQKERDDLQEIKSAVESANEAKSHFLEHITQETRDPIHRILDMDEKILDETHVERTAVCAAGIHEAGETLMTMVNDVLEYSAIEANRMTYEETEYDVVSFVSGIMKTIRPRIDEKELELEVNVDDDLPRHLFGDTIHIAECLNNLLTNAVKYTDEGYVTLSIFMVTRSEDRVHIRFSVEDTGIGIPEGDLNRLFLPFERLDPEGEHTGFGDEGTGLGLAVVQGLLKHMGSELNVESLYGSGSIFSFTIEQGVKGEEPVGDFDRLVEEETEEAVGEEPL